jgi:integrase/recombinase XerD
MNQLPLITLLHLMIDDNKCIGLQFQPSKIIQTLIKTLDQPRWSKENNMVFLTNTPANFDAILKTFRGFAWINCRYFLRNNQCTRMQLRLT